MFRAFLRSRKAGMVSAGLLMAVLALTACASLQLSIGTRQHSSVSAQGGSAPTIESISPAVGTIGTEIRIRGYGFSQEANDVAFTHESIDFQSSHTAYLNEVASSDGRTLRFTLPETLSACAFSRMGPGEACPMIGISMPTGQLEVSVVNGDDTSNGVTFERIARDRDVVEIIRGFDVNGNDRIDDGEFSAIVEAWTTAQIDDEVLLRAIDLWISQGSISSTQE